MDPLTAALNTATAALTLASKIWDAMPEPAKEQGASDWAKFTHNLGGFVISLQEKLK